jgi:hypothetical protein
MQEVLLRRAHHRAGALGATHSPRMKNSRGIGLGGAGQGTPRPSVSVTSSDLRKADTAQEILKTSVGSERIEGRP